MAWELVDRDVMGLNWNGIIRSSCPVLSLNEALLCVLRDIVPKRRLWSEREIRLGLMTDVS